MNPVSTTVVTNPLQALNALGQSIWLDYIRRSLITSGDLQRLIREDGLRGITSNPAIFEKAIGGSTDYNDSLKALQQEADYDAQALYERLAIADTYLSGLEALAANGADDRRIGGVASVASFFVSRIDTAVDALVNARLKETSDTQGRARLERLLGAVAIANAKLTYERYGQIY